MSFRATTAQRRCLHTSQTSLGSNGDQRRITCTGCHKVLFLWFHRQANKSLMQKHLFPEWIWVEDIADPDRGTGPNDFATAQPDHFQSNSAPMPAGSGEYPEHIHESKDEWTIIPNQCKEGCDCEYCVEESQCGQESY